MIIAMPAAGQDANLQAKAELERLQQSLKEKPISYPGVPNANAMVSDSLKAALQASSAGRLYMSLEDLCRATDALRGMWTAADQADAVKTGLPAYEVEWERVSLNLAATHRQVREQDWTDARAAIRGLAETADGRTGSLLDGGRGFAVSLEPKEGLIFLGQAQGEAEFAAFAASLHLPRKGTPYPLRSLLPELESLQQKTNAAFQPPRSIDLHARFMVLNSALKLAKELDASKFYAGALYQYLEAVSAYGMLDALPLDASQQSALKETLVAMRHKLDASQRDDSIARLFLERAESQVAHLDGSAPSSDDWRSAKVIVDQVVAAYFAADQPLALHGRAPGKTVDVTLVRWPYT